MSRTCSSTLNNPRNIKSGLSENCSEMMPTTRDGEKRKGGTMTDKKNVVIWGYESNGGSMKNIKAFIDLIEDNMSPINEEIKDDKLALEVWNQMGDLQYSLQDLLDEKERLAEKERNIQRVDAQVKGVKW